MRNAMKAGMEWYDLVDHQTFATPSKGDDLSKHEWHERNVAFSTLSRAKRPMPAKESQFRFQSGPQYNSSGAMLGIAVERRTRSQL